MFSTRNKKIISLGIFTLIISSFLFSCSNTSDSNQKEATTKSLRKIPKTELTFPVSTSLSSLMQKVFEKYSSIDTETTLKFKISDSTTGLNEVRAGTSFGYFSDVFSYDALPPREAKELIDTKFCVQGFAIIIHPGVVINNLSQQQIIDIFTGRMTNWKKLSGEDKPIVLVSRSQDNGSKIIFKKYALTGFKEIEKKVILVEDPQKCVQTVSQTPGAISYIPLANASNNSSIRILNFDGVEPTIDNIKTGKYPLWSYGHFYIKNPSSEIISKFSDYIKSDDIKPLIKEIGYIPISDMQVTR